MRRVAWGNEGVNGWWMHWMMELESAVVLEKESR